MSRKPRKLGRRRRRLYWTAGLLIAVAALGSAMGYAVYRSSRQETYRPGEELSEITRRLDLGIPEQAPHPRFVDVTAEAGLGGYRAFSGARTSQLPEDMGPGAAWGDFDRDGDDDLFVVAQGGPIGAAVEQRQRSRLFENRGEGTFAEVGTFPETRILGMGAAFGDYDGDGWIDLVVTGYDALRLYRNVQGNFTLDPAIAERPGFWAGASWADYDLDGDLDLYVCGYVQYIEDPRGAAKATQQYGRAVPYTLNPASFEPQRNLLFRNDGGGEFEEVAVALGVDNPSGRSLGALWHDLDEDGRPDLYVANDISDNALLMNRADGFEDLSHPAWVADYRGAMGLALGDWNRDGDDDLFITHWIAQENALYDSLLRDAIDRGDHDGPLRFMDVADQRGLGQVALQLIGWGTEFVDLDSDGWLDIVVANGSTFEDDGIPRNLRPQPPFLFWNRHGESFHDLASLDASLAAPRVSRGLAVSDYDLDGDADLLFVDRDGGVRLFRNEMAQGNRVGIRLVPRAGGFVEGSRIQATLPDGVVRGQPGGVSYLSQSSATVHLGLGSAARIDRLEIRWPDGATQAFDDVEANGLWAVERDAPRPVQVKRWNAEEGPPLSRERLAEFWRLQRAAMSAVKVEQDLPRAIELFRLALAIDPRHEDSIYYLGNALAETGEVDAALEQFQRIMRANSLSQRAYKRWGALRAATARNRADLDAAVEVLERAAAINPEETGVALVLGELHVLRDDPAAARRQLEAVVRSNRQSGEAYWVLAYLAWKSGDAAGSARLLDLARGTRGESFKPKGAVAEGEVRAKMHVERTLFEEDFEAWDGVVGGGAAFGAIEQRR